MSLLRRYASIQILFVIVVLGGVSVARSQDKPVPPLTPAQKAKLVERDRFGAETTKMRSEGKLPEAIKAAEKMMAIEREVFGSNHEEVAGSLDQLRDMMLQQDKFTQAKKYGEEAFEIRKKLYGGEFWQTTNARLALADIAFREQMTPKDRADLVEAIWLNNQVMGLFKTGKSREALALAQKAVAIRKHVLGENHPNYATSLNNLALLYETQGAYVQADPLYRQALEIRKKILGENHPAYAVSLNNLAASYQEQGAYSKAEPLYRQALEIKKRVLGENDSDYASSLNRLAGLYLEQGAYSQAEPLYRQALEIRKRVLGENHRDYAASLNNLAALHQAQGAYVQAEPLYRQASEIWKNALGENHPDYAASLNNLAMFYKAQGAYVRAEPLSRQALEIRKKALGENHPDYAQSLNNLALLYETRGAYVQAEQLSRQALEIRKQALGENHPHYALSLNSLAFLYLDQGAYVQAEPLFRQALEITQANLHAWAIGQSEQQQRISAGDLSYHLDSYLSNSEKVDSSLPTSYGFVLAWKGAIFSRRQRLLRDRDRPELATHFKEYQNTIQQLAKAAATTPLPIQQEAWQKRVASLNTKREELEAELSRKNATFRSEKALERIQPEQLAKMLPNGTALVDYLEYRHVEARNGGKGELVVERRLVAFVVRPDKALVRVELGPSEPVTKLVDGWRGTLKRRHPVQGKDDPAIQLRRRVWEPLAKHLEGVTTVLVSPDGALCKLPFAALPGANPEKYLLEELAVAVIPVPQLLPAILAPPPEQKQKTDEPLSMLAVGDVDFDALPGQKPAPPSGGGFRRQAVTRTGTMQNWKHLDSTRDEIRLIEDSFKEAGGHIKELRGAEATVSATRAELGKHAYVHLATHGFFAPAEFKSHFESSPETRRLETFEEQKNRATGYDPGLLSGLVLAGANKSAATGDSGILTATEVAELDLRKVELAVLSACETGLGEVAGGEGVLGLQRAFQVAGARTVVTSLWQVSDAQTKDLMVKFYRTYKDSGQMLESLRQAQLAMLRDGPNRGAEPLDKPENNTKPGRTPPFYWAAFVLSGDWR